MFERVLILALLLSQILSIFGKNFLIVNLNNNLGFNYLKFDGNLSNVDFSYEKVPLDKELQEVLIYFFKKSLNDYVKIIYFILK
jgi:hypothetical protein